MSDPQPGPVTVDLIPRARAAMEAVAQRRRLSATDTVNRALQLYDFFDSQSAAGAEMFLRYPDGTVKTVEVLP